MSIKITPVEHEHETCFGCGGRTYEFGKSKIVKVEDMFKLDYTYIHTTICRECLLKLAKYINDNIESE